VAETEEKALANARQFMWMQGEFTGLAHPVWSSPSGYFSPSNRTAFVEFAVGRRENPRAAAFEDQIADQQIIAARRRPSSRGSGGSSRRPARPSSASGRATGS
jgi:hypothetical protein